MKSSDGKFSARDRWGERVIVIVLALLGIALFLASSKFVGLLQQALASIGLTFLGSAGATGIILVLVGSDVGGLRKEVSNLGQEIDKLHNDVGSEIDTIHSSVGGMSALVSEAYSLGIVALGRSRQIGTFEGGKNLVERWKYLLEHANEVDIICNADRLLFNYDVFNHFFIDKLKKRMKEGQQKSLVLRVIISSLDNPANDEIDEWTRIPGYTKSRINDAKNVLTQLCGGQLDPAVVREHKSLVPFTLFRGDNYMYIMYFLPRHDGGPVVEIRPLEAITNPRNTLVELEDDKKLFQIYKSYFDYMWEEKAKQII